MRKYLNRVVSTSHSRIMCLTVGKCTYGTVRADIVPSKPIALVLISRFIEKILVKSNPVFAIPPPTVCVGECGAKCRKVSIYDGLQSLQ